MADVDPVDRNYVAWIRDSFARQGALATLGAEPTRIEPGLVDGPAGRPDAPLAGRLFRRFGGQSARKR